MSLLHQSVLIGFNYINMKSIDKTMYCIKQVPFPFIMRHPIRGPDRHAIDIQSSFITSAFL